ncbi:MICOS complex subunit MIC27 isoform X2 [Xiphias gladius]|uniref:MICOS complex subunit MIC27 isoform X2 n=1 Tax=Xiphias gladius TaxID=8245 RepID=UPI001A984D83|nr:MICOS complex subunit MIC27 isoform X2 [Xiphias gladius]
MAAKVVMVAVPTVLGIASIRVYTVSEVPTDGLVNREKLNIYTPLPQSAQVEFVPERPGVIESGLTAARQSIVPFFQAAKGACVSVKRGSVNLYHAAEDAYYYLKDPPPGFLPRFGTVTMAGLLGMFLARKGSRFKRVAVPLGLMSAGASVCYPAQAVVVFKVTGKKVYAAGKWSSAAVSSLLSSKPQETVAKESTASQSAKVSNQQSAVVEASESSSTTDSSPQSATIQETEVESAESVPASDESIAVVTRKEASSVIVTEIHPEQALTETNTDAIIHSVPAETETAPSSEEPPAPVESEEPSDTKEVPKNISNEASPDESTASLQPETVVADPAESAEVEVESAPYSEEPPALKSSDEPAVPVVESAQPEPTVQPELSDQPPVAAVEETPSPTLTPPPPPPPEQPAAENNKGGAGFKPDSSLMDFGQSHPEDEDLYSTRS